MADLIDRTIRGLDKVLYKEARMAAIQANMTIGD